LDSRITILGHVQRGGAPHAFDRIMSTMLGAKAVEVAIDPANRNKSLVVVLTENNTIKALSLTECVRRTQNVTKLIHNHQYDEAVKERGTVFEELWQFYLRTHLPTAPARSAKRGRIGIMHAGAVSPGMNVAVRALTRALLERGYQPMAINSGLDGLVCGERLTPLSWTDVSNWSYLGGALLSTRRGIAFEHGVASVTRKVG
jgi:6-phosphofructokinase 1